MRRFIFFLLVLFTWGQLAFASLYPTYPVGTTKCTAGAPIRMTWIDTRDRPHLREMGSISIDLHMSNGEPAAHLAERVSPMRREHTVDIPRNVTTGIYAISFTSTSTYPPIKFWTHNFLIDSPVTDSALSSAPPQLVDATDAALFTIVLPTTTIISQLAPTPALAPAATTVTAGPPPAGGEAGEGLNRMQSSSGGRHLGADFRTSRFRLVYVVWPALVGISLAL